MDHKTKTLEILENQESSSDAEKTHQVSLTWTFTHSSHFSHHTTNRIYVSPQNNKYKMAILL